MYNWGNFYQFGHASQYVDEIPCGQMGRIWGNGTCHETEECFPRAYGQAIVKQEKRRLKIQTFRITLRTLRNTLRGV